MNVKSDVNTDKVIKDNITSPIMYNGKPTINLLVEVKLLR